MAPPSAFASPVATHEQACARHFSELCALFDDNEWWFTYEISQLRVSNSYGQFKVGASNIGALQSIQSATSLDYRLREVLKVSKHVVVLPQALDEALEDGIHWPILLPQAMAITQKRQYLRYCREHHAKLSKVPGARDTIEVTI